MLQSHKEGGGAMHTTVRIDNTVNGTSFAFIGSEGSSDIHIQAVTVYNIH